MNAKPASPRRTRAILRIHFHPAERSEELYGQLLTVLDGISSRVEPLPADWSAYVDLTGALTYWGRDVEGLVAVLRLRLLALHGVPSSAGAGPTRSIAAMAADVTPPGAATVDRDDPYEIAGFLRTKRPPPCRASPRPPGRSPATASPPSATSPTPSSPPSSASSAPGPHARPTTARTASTSAPSSRAPPPRP
ncbi:hypothetical protein [Streptomyces pratensis]|uniref:hypothetical protein n=1 Tax=Streptomyces pratensis TaxID=1169025 RepID=UPI00363B61FA